MAETPPATSFDAVTHGSRQGPFTLGIDIGGSNLKCGVLDRAGAFVADQVRTRTPKPALPDAVMATLAEMVAQLPPFDRISIGFPGSVRDNTVFTAPNLGTEAWRGVKLAARLAERFGKPARMLNDGSVQGLGVVSGEGIECVITLGTGCGFALFHQGRLAPHLELGQHIAWKKRTYDRYIGNVARDDIGLERWNARLRRVIAQVETLTGFDVLYVGGGNAKQIQGDLPANVRTVSNKAGVSGGVKLWGPSMAEWFPNG